MSGSQVEEARAAWRSSRPDAALAAAHRALALDDRSIDALEIVALVARSRGDVDEAEQRLRAIVAIAPAERWPRDDLARLLIENRRPSDAETVLRAAIAADPGHADAHALFGALLSEREALVDGAWHLEHAITLAGRHPQLLANLARNRMRQGMLVEAGALADEAQRAMPGDLAIRTLLAEIAERAGALPEAEAALDAAEPLARRAGTDLLLASATLWSRGERWTDALAALDGLDTLSGAARLLRGRLRDRAGRYDEAWADFVTGKARLAQQSGRRYDPVTIKHHFAALAETFSAVFWQAVPCATVRRDTPQPIFIFGFPRSGTTLTEQMLSSHSAIRPGGELPIVGELLSFIERGLGEGPFPAGLSRLATADHRHWPALFRDFYLARAEQHGLTAPGARFFTDKMPLNEAYAPLLRLAFPEAPMILIRRHPLDTLVSVMAHDMTHGFHSGYAIGDAAQHYAAVARLVDGYRPMLGGVEWSYERFVADQPGETARLMHAIGLPVEETQFRFHDNRRHAPTPSYAQVQQPLHERSIGRWRAYAAHLAPYRDLLTAEDAAA